MNPLIATFICVCGIVAFFYLDRDNSVRTSKAIWVPTIYFCMTGSRAISAWITGVHSVDVSTQIDGDPIAAASFTLLLVAAAIVLFLRIRRVRPFLISNWAIIAFFAYCFVSASWSSHPDIAIKRWIKSLDDLAMCLVIVTDRQPIEALKRVISRVGYILLPISLLLIKYYGDLGRDYTPEGMIENIGVATSKNMLGVTLFVVSLFTIWRVLALINEKKLPHRRRHLIAQLSLLLLACILLQLADSKTSTACVLLGGFLMYVAGMRAIRIRPYRVHIICLGVFLVSGIAMLTGGESYVVQAMGRQSNLSGRTDIWAALIASAPNPIIGAGFESFWISPNVRTFQEELRKARWYHAEFLNESHNGYLEVYLNLGIVGLVLILIVLISGYRGAVAAYRKDPASGALMIAIVIVSAFYSITEAGFRMLDLTWICLLLAIFSASGIRMGAFNAQPLRLRNSRRQVAKQNSVGIDSAPDNVRAFTNQSWLTRYDHAESNSQLELPNPNTSPGFNSVLKHWTKQ